MCTGVTKAPSHSSSFPSSVIGLLTRGMRPTTGLSWATPRTGMPKQQTVKQKVTTKRIAIISEVGTSGSAVRRIVCIPRIQGCSLLVHCTPFGNLERLVPSRGIDARAVRAEDATADAASVAVQVEHFLAQV